MFGTGCPTGGGQGVGVGAVDGTPIFGFSEWGLDLADLDVPLSEDEIAAGLEPPTEVEKFCVEEMKLGGGPPGYKVRVPAVTVGGVAALEEGSALRISIETTIGGEVGGGNEIVLLPADITDGAFEALIENPSEVWSECIADDGVVPLIGVKTSLSLFREGDEATAGTVGAEDDSAVTVHFAAVWEEC
ncbi:unnamed protein product [Parascedosporium putredinis]|uniref:Uncharacterized protein n=1 Tax=Parascedosporium putredinis TaxID=1442378 RepID=A0A9P1H6Z8_9PEZI|nr:unnamed protein product [Parascedosporium putredinis]CAI7999363.1 unnamed protein product [Parascedosporium putredinis]